MLLSSSSAANFEFTFFLMLRLTGFILKPAKSAYRIFLGTRDFQNNSLFERSACFYVTVTGNFGHFQYSNFETSFLKTENFFLNWRSAFQLNILRLKTQHFHTKLPCQKPTLKQTKWGIQNGLITKNGVLPVTALFFSKFYFSIKTSYKELIC